MSKLLLLGLALTACVFMAAGSSFGQEKKGPKVGDKAPAFESVDETGKAWKSSDVVGKKILVLYFYPADFTGGCTSQACGYRDDIEKLKVKDVEVVGVSGDSVSTHKLFKSHHKLNFTLLADEKGTVAKTFGVPVTLGEKTSPTINDKGEKGTAPRLATIQRFTVVIGKDGKIAAIDQVSKAGEDPKRIADLVQKLSK